MCNAFRKNLSEWTAQEKSVLAGFILDLRLPISRNRALCASYCFDREAASTSTRPHDVLNGITVPSVFGSKNLSCHWAFVTVCSELPADSSGGRQSHRTLDRFGHHLPFLSGLVERLNQSLRQRAQGSLQPHESPRFCFSWVHWHRCLHLLVATMLRSALIRCRQLFSRGQKSMLNQNNLVNSVLKRAARNAILFAIAGMVITILLGALALYFGDRLASELNIDKGMLALLVLIVGFDATAILAIADVNQAHAHQFEELAGKTNSLHGDITSVTTSSAEEVRSKLRGFEHAIDSIADARYLGTGRAALDTILDKTKSAQEVRNTLVLFGVPELDMPAVLYTKENIGKIHDCIEQVLSKGGSWTDIVSQEVVNSSSLNWFGFIEQVRAKAVASKQDPTGPLSRHRLRRLKESYPIINFMILGHEDNKEEVIFGWGHHSQDPGGRLFMTQNTHLVNLFDRFWNMLDKDSVPFRPDTQWSIAAADVVGLWFTVAHLASSGWVPGTGKPPDGEPVNTALVNIDISDHRSIIAKGIIFEGDKRRSIESVAADLTQDRLWFLTRNSETGFNAGYYRFVHPMKSAAAIDESQSAIIHEFYGEFSDPTREESTTSGKLVLCGHRITKEWTRIGNSNDAVRNLPDDPQGQQEIIRKGLEWWRQEGRKRWSCESQPGPSKLATATPPPPAVTPPPKPDTNTSQTPPGPH